MGNETRFEFPFPFPFPSSFATGPALWKISARMQIEAMALMARRAQAYMELPQTLAQCHNPQDILTEQVRFWQIAQRQYMAGFDKAFADVNATADPLAAGAASPQRPRDYMVVSQTPPAATDASRDTDKATVREPAPRVRRTA